MANPFRHLSLALRLPWLISLRQRPTAPSHAELRMGCSSSSLVKEWEPTARPGSLAERFFGMQPSVYGHLDVGTGAYFPSTSHHAAQNPELRFLSIVNHVSLECRMAACKIGKYFWHPGTCGSFRSGFDQRFHQTLLRPAQKLPSIVLRHRIAALRRSFPLQRCFGEF